MDISTNLSKITGSATAQIFSIAKEMENEGKDIIHLEIGQGLRGATTFKGTQVDASSGR